LRIQMNQSAGHPESGPLQPEQKSVFRVEGKYAGEAQVLIGRPQAQGSAREGSPPQYR
jgi:hypothetical protein